MTTFRVNDIIVNRATKKKAMVVDVEHDWRFPVYVIEYQDDIGGTMRFNVQYEKHWEKIEYSTSFPAEGIRETIERKGFLYGHEWSEEE